jgi:soluble lytic murein transglycosylase-like protein
MTRSTLALAACASALIAAMPATAQTARGWQPPATMALEPPARVSAQICRAKRLKAPKPHPNASAEAQARRASQWALVVRTACKVGVPVKLFDALIMQESAYDPWAISRVGAAGLTQLMPLTSGDLGVVNPFEPAENLKGGATYLKRMLARFGTPELALAAYNAGPGAVSRAGGIPAFPETQTYVARILDAWRAVEPGPTPVPIPRLDNSFQPLTPTPLSLTGTDEGYTAAMGDG